MCNGKDGLLKQLICCRNTGKARTAIGEKFVLRQEREKKIETNELAESYAIQELNLLPSPNLQ